MSTNNTTINVNMSIIDKKSVSSEDIFLVTTQEPLTVDAGVYIKKSIESNLRSVGFENKVIVVSGIDLKIMRKE